VKRALVAIACIGSAFYAGSTAGASAAPEPVNEAVAALRLAPSDPTGAVSGAFSRAGSYVEFESEQTSPTETPAAFSVNGKAFSIERDAITGTTVWTGNGTTLVPEDRAVLRGLVDALNESWVRPALEADLALPAEQDLLARMAFLLAEAPLGVPMVDSRVERSVERFEDVDGAPSRPVPSWSAATVADPSLVRSAAGAPPSPSRLAAEKCIADVARSTSGQADLTQLTDAAIIAAAAACQVSDNNGIWYWSCSTLTRSLCHDTRGHCYLCESIRSGPSSSECYGECGPGCNGLNIYTYDCGDHDRCARVHGGALNPWDADCGDEYRDAADDFLNGWPNC